MKILISILISILLISCGCNSTKEIADSTNNPDSVEVIKGDNVILINPEIVKENEALQKKSDSLLNLIVVMFDQKNKTIDSLSKINDSLVVLNNALYEKSFVYGMKLERIKYYVKICMQNPSQKTFLLGWVRRVVEL